MVKKIIAELDLSDLDDAEIETDQIRDIHVVYYNIGEDSEWEEFLKKLINSLLSLFFIFYYF